MRRVKAATRAEARGGDFPARQGPSEREKQRRVIFKCAFCKRARARGQISPGAASRPFSLAGAAATARLTSLIYLFADADSFGLHAARSVYLRNFSRGWRRI